MIHPRLRRTSHRFGETQKPVVSACTHTLHPTFMAKIWHHFRSSAYSTQNTILTKLLRWEYDKKMSHFRRKSLSKFCIWCVIAHWQGFFPMYTACINMLGLRQAEAYRSTKHMMHVAYTRKPMSLTDMDRGNHTYGRSCNPMKHEYASTAKPWMHTHTPRLKASMIRKGLPS